MLVVPNEKSLASSVKNLNLKAVNLDGAVANAARKKFVNFGKKKFLLFPFFTITQAVAGRKEHVWLIDGADEVCKLKKFLTVSGVPEKNIVNFNISSQNSGTWSANVRHVEKHGADFFATGNEYMRDGLNLKYIPSVHEDKNFSRGSANLSDAFQDLQQSFLTAKHIFKHVKRGTVKFVLIGLTPDSFLRDNSKDFVNRSKNLQYLSLTDSTEEDERLKILLGKKLKKIFSPTPEQADLNFDALKKNLSEKFSFNSITDWQDFKFSAEADVVKKNIQILKDYIKLCRDNDAEPIGVVFPFAPAARKTYDEKILSNFRKTIHQLEENDGFFCVDMFDINLKYNCFRDMTHLNEDGMKSVNSFLALNLYKKKLIPVESFCDMTYDYFNCLSEAATKDDYNDLMERVFEVSAQLIRRKKKIKLGFALYLDAQWSGDELYNFFVGDERFETTVFLCKRIGGSTDNKLFHEDFVKGLEHFKSHNLNVVPVENPREILPTQDVIIFLTPYFANLPKFFRPASLTTKTLITHITYSFSISVRGPSFYNRSIFHTAWKIFFSSVIGRKVYAKYNSVGMPRGVFSGYPRMDIFFKENQNFTFDWKMTRPDAKKIIWAPHWTINASMKYATFQWNCQFMYEFAKAHPEISWVLKPHPGLFFAAVQEKVFPSLEAFEEYLKKWNELPNAQVYTGGYYQAIFATSDGMIHDSGSFIAEYQFVDKPMIFLTRENEVFNELGKVILKETAYLVDGKNLDAIAATMQKVFIEGNDDKAAARKKVFDQYLNYPKANGMTASEFIYRSIADELKEVSP